MYRLCPVLYLQIELPFPTKLAVHTRALIIPFRRNNEGATSLL